jgi:hypothetical protein
MELRPLFLVLRISDHELLNIVAHISLEDLLTGSVFVSGG